MGKKIIFCIYTCAQINFLVIWYRKQTKKMKYIYIYIYIYIYTKFIVYRFVHVLYSCYLIKFLKIQIFKINNNNNWMLN